MALSGDNVQKRENLLLWKSHMTITKRDAYIINEMQFKINLQLSFTKINHFFQLPAFYLVHAWLTTLLLPWTS